MTGNAPQKNALDDLRIDRSSDEPPRSRTGIWILLIFILLLIAGSFTWHYLAPNSPVVTVITVPNPDSTPTTDTVLNASGYVTARRKATVSSKVTGKIIEVLIEEGMAVKEGQVLARLDTSNIDANLNLARAQADSAQAALGETKALLHQAEQDLARVQDLAQQKIASTAELDAAQAQAQSLQARLLRQQQEVVVAQRGVDLWSQELSDRTIKAPFDGVVVAKNAQPGEMISPISAGGGFTRTGVGTLVDMSSLEIEVDVNESYINRVQPGQTVSATLDSYPDWKIPTSVIAIIPTADRQKATVRVRIGFDQLDPRILPEMGVKVAFRSAESTPTTTPTPALRIPAAAVHHNGTDSTVWVVKDNTLERRAIQTGPETGDLITVVAGLNPGEQIVTDGPQDLADGDTVRKSKP